VGFRFYRRKSLGQGFWLGLSKSRVSLGKRGKPVSASVAALVAGLVAVLALPSAATPTPPGRDGLIAFVSRGPQWEPRGLAVIRPDGGGFRHLTRNRYDSSPAWSPDGRRIAFVRTGAIYVMRSDGARVRKLTTPRIRGDRWPAWSPNGGEIAFTREGAAVFVMRADGTRQHPLYRRRGRIVDRPSWSPDGRRIAFGVPPDDLSDGGSIVVIGRGGGKVHYVTNGRVEPPDPELGDFADDHGPDWSPDGKRIAFTRVVWLCGQCDVEQVFSANVNGSGVVWVIHEEGYVESSSPSWSPDGTQIVAASGGLWMFTAAGERVRRLSRGSDPDWSR
jgi:TolB protein